MMIDEAKVYEGLAPIFEDVFMRDDIVLSPDLTAHQVEGWDSFRQIEIIMAAEARFNFKFSSAEIDAMRSLGDLVAIVARKGQADRA